MIEKKRVAQRFQPGLGDLFALALQAVEQRAPLGHRGHPAVRDSPAPIEVEGGELRTSLGHRGHPGVSDFNAPPEVEGGELRAPLGH